MMEGEHKRSNDTLGQLQQFPPGVGSINKEIWTVKVHNISGYNRLQVKYISVHNINPLTPEECEPGVYMNI